MAIRKALAEANGVHNQQIAELERQLAAKQSEIDAGQRTISNAELGVKAGHVYIISNIGSFGEGVFKIGMSRRDDPQERIDELGSASVPFPFDVHMMISCQDAPTLETALHRSLNHCRVNKIKLQKEFFRTDRETLMRLVEQHHGKVEYIVSDDYAAEFFNSQKVTPEMEAEIAASFVGILDFDE
ncbi:MAG: GIY-YIG nuclease family protein [Thermoguttaceae bacterium]